MITKLPFHKKKKVNPRDGQWHRTFVLLPRLIHSIDDEWFIVWPGMHTRRWGVVANGWEWKVS